MRILSWNIQWGRGADGQVDLARTIAAIEARAPLDIVCLQEVACGWPALEGMDRPQDQPALIAAAFPSFGAIYAAGVERFGADARRVSFGNLMLCRPAAGQVFRRLLPMPPDEQHSGMQRTCIELVVNGATAPFRMLTTHLEYYSQRQRRAQIEALRAIQSEAVESVRQARSRRETSLFGLPPRPSAAILCGDLNCAPEAEEFASLQADGGWRDAWRIAHGAAPHAPSVGLHGAEWPEHPYCCDYFLVTPELAPRVRDVEVIAATDASDHQPLVLDIDL